MILHHILHRIETGVLTGATLMLVLLSAGQIVLRNLSQGLIWAETLQRMLVLWIAMVGAMAASRTGSHIRIDAVERLLPIAWRKRLQRLAHGVSGTLCLVASWYAFLFVRVEYESGARALGAIPNWACAAVIPVALFIIGMRHTTEMVFPALAPPSHRP
jgi:TRAP-type C4-dicarboxylate transport system permease small subunit